ncbi:MAG: dehydratase [Pseudonocardia sp. SCN 72-86]|nr:MAG: dehydratase [Pseudonocardia sp. SCN 72-86]
MTVKAGWEGRFLEDFQVGDVYRHPLGRTVENTDNTWFTLLTMNTNQAHFNEQVGAGSEFGRRLVVSTLTLAIAIGQSVTDLTQNAFANLGLDDVTFTHPVFAGDTLWSESQVLGVRASASRPDAGIVEVHTRTLNQDGDVVCSFRRTFYVHGRGAERGASRFPTAREPMPALDTHLHP